jgi:hypothetical protein
MRLNLMPLKRIVLFVVWPLVSSALFAEEASVQFTPVSVAGSGGVHNAEEDGVFTLLGNPALLNSITSSMFFAFSGGAGDIYRGGALGLNSPSAYYTVTGPLALGVVSKGVGFGLFNHLRFYSGGIDMNLVAVAGIDWALVNTDDVKLDFGLAPKLLYRYRLIEEKNASSLFAASITPGILVSLGSGFSVGISCDDALSAAFPPDENNTAFSQIPRSLNAGVAAGIISNGTLGLTFFTDYRDLLKIFGNDAGDPMQGLGIGIRAAFWNNFWVSAGMSGLAPTGGFGLNLGAVKLDIALSNYGAEAGIRITRD